MMVCLTLLTLYYYMRICYSAFMLNYWEINWNYNQNYLNFNMKMSLLLSFFSISGLLLFNMMFYIY
uniref:NADH dehydrogenase subunit 2 n=1 Tax=Metalimnobia quadrinotata TaxID=2719075 RepID=A0A7D6W9I5_9DIPT|nr:NADH dehydrogenase subunit 2 [Metalimnobia quadrinotata]